MCDNKAVKLDIELTEQQAMDLAQLIKRMTFADFRGCAADEDEAYRMIKALGCVRESLARHGYDPR